MKSELKIVGNPDIEKISNELQSRFPVERESQEYQSVYYKENPLVTVTIATFNRCEMLLEYSLKSVLDQTYKNLEIIIVGDRCTDNTEESIKNIKDSRIKFFNITERPEYPGTDGSRTRWLVAGSYPFDLSMRLATGDFLTHLDDDDSFTPERIEKLVKFMREKKCDAVHHPFSYPESTVPSNKWEHGQVTTSALFMHGWFRNVPADIDCYKIDEPGDWNRCKRIMELGAKIERHPELLTIKSK